MNIILPLVLALSAAPSSTTSNTQPNAADTPPVTSDNDADWATGPTEILPTEMPGSKVLLYTNNYKELKDGTRQIGYSATFPHPNPDLKANVTLEGIVEVKCAAKEYRHIHMKYTDEKGVTEPAPPRFAPDEWNEFINDPDDKAMYKRMCGAEMPTS